MFGIKKISSKPKTKLYHIEIDDDKIDEQLTKIIIDIENKTKEFKSHINENTLSIKEDWINEMHKLILTIQSDTTTLHEDLNKIINIELENKDFLIIKDDEYLQDKKRQLQIIRDEVDQFIMVIDQRPSAQALQSELLENITSQIQIMNASIQKLVTDDHKLRHIYKKLNEI